MLKWIQTKVTPFKKSLKSSKASKVAKLIAYNSVGQPIGRRGGMTLLQKRDIKKMSLFIGPSI
jgi:hypothetical protein